MINEIKIYCAVATSIRHNCNLVACDVTSHK